MVNLNDPQCQRFINVIVSVILELAQQAAEVDSQQKEIAFSVEPGSFDLVPITISLEQDRG